MECLDLKHFRCFAEPGAVPLRPLTLLIGENSTGKSSFLSAIRLAWDAVYASRVNFNEEPFLLGAFDQIAHYRGGRWGRAATFDIGFEEIVRPVRRAARRQKGEPVRVRFSTTFKRAGSHPVLESQSIAFDSTVVTVSMDTGQESVRIYVSQEGSGVREAKLVDSPRLRISPESTIDWRYISFVLRDFDESGAPRKREDYPPKSHYLSRFDYITSGMPYHARFRPVALAPVRTRPQRTYNPVSETPLPEGEHVPMVLAKTFFENKPRWQRLKETLDRFGEASGLFSSLDIKGLGRHESDPFQIRLKIKGPPANLIDVGYGVSQVLPILVDALLAGSEELYLLQQPEVHLHPRAQAELGSFLGGMVAAKRNRFVIETHSDYMLDRIRSDIRDRRELKPTDVSLLYFERNGVEVSITPMQIDEAGNLIDAPDGYRRFFLQEEKRFLGLS